MSKLEAVLDAGLGPILFKDVSYYDDIAVPIAANNNDIINKIALTMETIYHLFYIHGFNINLNSGKTEAIVGIFGKGSKGVKNKICFNQNYINFNVCNHIFKIKVVNDYKHLGTIISFSSNADVDALTRTAIMNNEYHKIYNHFLKHGNTSIKNKITICKTYIFLKAVTIVPLGPCLVKRLLLNSKIMFATYTDMLQIINKI